MNTLPEHSCDTSIIGSSTAGPSLALRLTDQHQVIILSKSPTTEGSTLYAQDGITAVFDETDNIDSHVKDTLVAGAGTYDHHAVESVASNARSCMQWLIDQGVLFDTHIQPNGEESCHLTREGGHNHHRILHTADAIGREIETTLVSKAQNHPNIRVSKRSNTVDLIASDKIGLPSTQRVIGAWVWNRNKETIETCHAEAVVLATGGTSEVYQYTTNPDVSSGGGIVMAQHTGCRIANLEFNQLHPTTLYHPQARNFLLAEVLRDEGAYLKRPDGMRSVPDLDERDELAPRDIVVHAIDHGVKRLDADCIFLDINHKSADFIRQHFPMTYEKLLGLGIDLTKKPVLIVSTAHYTCDGVMVGDYGRTDVEGLYAIGEVSYTDLHSASRMASDSLLGYLVYDWSTTEDISGRIPYAHDVSTLPPWDENRAENSDERVVIQHNWHELRPSMWDYVSIVRTAKRLGRTLRRITMLQQEVDECYAHFRVSSNLLELCNLVQVAELITRCAMMRRESRGLYFTLGYPELLTHSGPSILPISNHYISK